MLTFKELRNQLDVQDIENILGKYDIKPHYKHKNYVVYETCCHNKVGEGSPKLYYYPNTHLFKCYTQCGEMFDIFELIIKIEANTNDRRIGKSEAIKIAGFELSSQQTTEIANDSLTNDLARAIYLNNMGQQPESPELLPLETSFLDERYVFDLEALQAWVDEGISVQSMFFYNITYDPIDNCIVIPQYDGKGNVVGVRGRFLGENVVDKYRPIYYNGILLNCPTNAILYGFWQNREAIKLTKTAIIFESEKSVLMMDTIYGSNNISVAVFGQKISKQHIQLLLSLNVNSVIVAFDADYKNAQEAKEKFKDYKRICKGLDTYFTVSLIMDYEGLLLYKDSPIDRGEEIFNKLMKERVYI